MRTLKIHKNDNVAVMLEGEKRGHKLALRDIKAGEDIIKYGYAIGHATEDIKEGEHVHTHNLESKRGRGFKKQHRIFVKRYT